MDTVRITVHGVCEEPTPGYKLTLTRLEGQGIDPSTLLLYLSVVAPTGIEPDHVTPTNVEYTQNFVIPKDHIPTQVIILTGQATIKVEAAKP